MNNWFTRLFDFLGKNLKPGEMSSICIELADKAAFKVLAINIAVGYIANALSKCEIKVIRDGVEVHDKLYYRLNISPNPNQSGAQMMNALVGTICTETEALVVPYKDNHLHIADAYSIDDSNPLKDNVFRGVSVGGLMLKKSYKAEDCYFFKLDNVRVQSLINSLFSDYSQLLSIAMDAFRKTHGSKYKLKLENTKAGDPKFNEEYKTYVQDQLTEFLRSDNAIYPQFAGYDLVQMPSESQSSSDDIISMRKEVFDLVAQAFKIPISMMYGNTNNTNDVLSQFLTFAVDPIAQMMSDELTRKSFTYEEWVRGSEIKVDTKRINHIDIFNVAEKLDKLISCGVFSIDDVLSELGFQKLNTEFSAEHFMTKNYARAEEVVNNLSDEGGEM